MDQTELRNSLTASLSQMYEMEVITNLAEFWQGELRVLHYVHQHNNSKINPSVLSDALHVSRARITTALSALRKKGYIVMEMSQDDRRRMCVTLTSDGEQYLKKKQKKVEKYFDILINGLGEVNVRDFIRIIDLSIKVMDSQNSQ